MCYIMVPPCLVHFIIYTHSSSYLEQLCVDVVLSYDGRGVSVLQYGAEEEIRRRETSKGEEPQTDGGARATC